jgi:vanillate O-demethylase ferredoxin subunit
MNRRVYLHAITRLARDASAFEFRSVDGAPLPAFTAGAHVDLILPNSVRRSYSLCNAEGETHRYVVGVKKASPSRGASSYLHEQLRVGAEIEIAPPRNNFPLAERAQHSVLIAGGIGVTPIWSMIQRLVALGASFELHYASRTPQDAAFVHELERLAASEPVRMNFAFSRETGGRRLDLDAIVAAAPSGSHFYACGPAEMLRAFEQATSRLPHEQVHLERFGAGDAETRTGGAGFEIILARSNRTLEVPAEKSILDVLLDEGVDVPFSCMDGVCGSCKVDVLEGMPDHRDVVLDAEERAVNRTMLVCCSRALSERLVLNL